MMKEDHLMQIIRITIDGVTYEMFSPLIAGSTEEVGQIEEIHFGECVQTKHVVGFLLQYLNDTGLKYDQKVH